MSRHVRVEAQRLMQDTWPTYFVDMVDGEANEKLHSTTDLDEARRVARVHADSAGVRVVDETYVPEVMARFGARFEAADAIQRAMLPGEEAARGQFQHFYNVMGEPDSRDALGLLQNRGMAQSTAERQRAFKEAMKKAGFVRLEAYVTKEQRDKFRQLGGDEWLRKKIEAARIPQTSRKDE